MAVADWLVGILCRSPAALSVQNSVYGLFPFFTPGIMKTHLQKLGVEKSYAFERPVAKPVEEIVDAVGDIQAILSDEARYRVPEAPLFGKETACKFSVVANLCVVCSSSPPACEGLATLVMLTMIMSCGTCIPP